MFRRGRPILRTAAIMGTATAVSGAVSHRQQARYARQDAEAEPQQYAAPAPAAASAQPDMAGELTQLAQLHAEGILTDEEFAAKKAQLLGI